jgi:site-specific DNA-adenine methylase
MRYPGGKNGSGSYQRIISEIPLHSVYIELFAGSAAVFRNKIPAMRSILLDVDFSVLRGLKRLCGPVQADFLSMSAVDFLRMYPFDGSEFVYVDPPYLFDTRLSGDRGIYRCEFGSMLQHTELLSMLTCLPCKVAISGYASALYFSMLQEWRVISWRSKTRVGVAVEYLWCNYAAPALLHDPRYVGGSFTERQRLRRLAGVSM